MEFRILGPIEAVASDHAVGLGGPKELAVLVLLLLSPGRVMARERLIELLWDGEPPKTADHALEVYISNLRRQLRTAEADCDITSVAPGYLLSVPEDAIDLYRFVRLAREGRRELKQGEFLSARDHFRQALEFWRGPPFGGAALNQFLASEIAQLELDRLAVTEDRIEADLGLGRHGDLVPELRRLVAEHPLRERLSGQLMLALYRTGQQAEASGVYQALRSGLAEELGMNPSPELQALVARILRQEAGLAAAEPMTNLPLSLTSFVGRREDLKRIEALLAKSRIVTLVGAAGIGKTRLALESARELLGGYPDGVWLVELSGLRDGSVIPDAIRSVLGLTEGGSFDPLSTICDGLRERRVLLLLDNCEHLIEDAATVIEALLTTCPQVACLATSRERMRIRGEQVWTVEGLPVASEAVQLFLDRAALTRASFSLSEADQPVIAEICRRLDGIPLALELGAAQLARMSGEEILRRLDDPYRVLESGSRTAPARHQTLLAAVEWSYSLLTGEERLAFDRLSVFRGFDIDAAAAVSSESTTLMALTDKSLVAFDGSRYRLLETLRMFASQRLEDRGLTLLTEAAHCRHFLGLVEDRGPGELATWLGQMETETDNLRAAFSFALDNDHDAAARLILGLDWWWRMRAHIGEVRNYLDRLLQVRRAQDATLVRLLAYQGWFCWDVDGPAEISPQAMDSALRLARAVGDRAALADALLIWSRYATNRDEIDVAEKLLQEALALLREGGDQVRLAEALHQLGVIHGAKFDLTEARACMEESLAIQRALQRSDEAAITLGFVGGIASATGDLQRGRELAREALRIGEELGGEPYLHQLLDVVAGVAIMHGEPALGLTLAGAADAALVRAGWKANRTWDRLIEAYLAVAREALGADQAAASDQAGHLLRYPEAVGRALAWLDQANQG